MRLDLKQTIDIIDEGLLVYRRGFPSFALVAAIGLVPVALGVGATFAAVSYLGEDVIVLMVLIWFLLAVLVLVLLAGAVSRLTMAIRGGEPISVWRAMAIGPARLAGMGCFGLLGMAVLNILSSIATCIILFPIYCGLIFSVGAAFGGSSALGPLGETAGVLLGVVTVLVTILLYGFSIVLSGAVYCGTVYLVQPFALERGGLGEAARQGLDTFMHRFGRNLLAFLLTSLAFGALAVVVTAAVGLLLPLPVGLALGAESPVTGAVGATAWLVGLAVVLPLMPIWMALLYTSHRDERFGGDLSARVAALGPLPAPPAPPPLPTPGEPSEERTPL